MAATVDTLVTEFRLRDNYTAPAKGIVSATHGIGSAITDTLGKAAKLGMAGAAGLGAGILGLGVSAVKAAADMERLELALKAAVGEGAFKATLAEMKEIAKLPGLGLGEAIQGFSQLFTVSKDAKLSADLLRNFGNAIAAVGGGREQLGRVTVNLMQVMGAGKLMGDELREISMLAPQFREALVKVFGTSDSQSIAKTGLSAVEIFRLVNAEMSKMPRVAGGATNSFENLADGIKTSLAEIGRPLLATVAKVVEGVGSMLQGLVDSQVFTSLGQAWAQLFDPQVIIQGIGTAISWIIATLGNIPAMVIQVGEAIRSQFGAATDSVIKLASILGGLFVGGAVVKGVMALVTAYKTWAAVTKTVATAQAFLTALIPGGIAAVAAGLVAAAGATAVIDAALRSAGDGVKGIDLNKLPAFDQISQDQAGIQRAMQDGLSKAQKEAEAKKKAENNGIQPGGGLLDGLASIVGRAMPGAGAGALSPLDAVASNTSKMVELQEKQNAILQDQILGGGVVGSGAASPANLDRALRGGARAGGGEMEDAMLRLIRAVRAEMLGTMTQVQRVGAFGGFPAR